MKRILIVDDESVIRSQVAKLLGKAGYTTDCAGSVEEAIGLGLNHYDLILSDVRLPDRSGTDLIERASPTPVVIMTSYASIQSAVDCMKQGAADYVAKPFDHDELLMTLGRVLRHSLLSRQNEALKSTLARDYPIEQMVGACQAMQDVMQRMRRVAAAEVTVLIHGESGTGKELAARAIHELSPRSNGPFVPVNCAAIPENLIEAELFGHEKGAFTGAIARKQGLIESAHGGTLFMDEVAELSPATQARLLRVLQEGEVRTVGATQARRVDVRVVAATHRDLEALVRSGDFREDLFYRLKVTDIHLPPLRERGKDLDRLAQYFLERSRSRLNRPDMHFSEGAVRAMHAYSWPGNIRELSNAVERAVILANDDAIGPNDLALPMLGPQLGPQRGPMPAANGELSLDGYFRDFVLRNQARLSETELARALGISRKTLWERRARMGLKRA